MLASSASLSSASSSSASSASASSASASSSSASSSTGKVRSDTFWFWRQPVAADANSSEQKQTGCVRLRCESPKAVRCRALPTPPTLDRRALTSPVALSTQMYAANDPHPDLLRPIPLVAIRGDRVAQKRSVPVSFSNLEA
eukprot:scaffold69_cov248-Pinguiococcus_pyrenoidosus.AAC.64